MLAQPASNIAATVLIISNLYKTDTIFTKYDLINQNRLDFFSFGSLLSSSAWTSSQLLS